MFRDLRRKNKKLDQDATFALLKEEKRGVLAMNSDDGYPYAVPINFIYDEDTNKIYFHGAGAGQKYESLMKDSKVCFTVYGHEEIRNNEWAHYMQSVIVFGQCLEVEENKLELLRKVARKYYPSEEEIEKEISIAGSIVKVFEIEIDHICGKQIQEK